MAARGAGAATGDTSGRHSQCLRSKTCRKPSQRFPRSDGEGGVRMIRREVISLLQASDWYSLTLDGGGRSAQRTLVRPQVGTYGLPRKSLVSNSSSEFIRGIPT